MPETSSASEALSVQQIKAGSRSGRAIKRDGALAAGRNGALRDERITEIRFRSLVSTLGVPHELGGFNAKLLSSEQSTDDFYDARPIY